MANLNSNMLLAIFAVILLCGIILYLNKNDDQPIPNEGSISNNQTNSNNSRTSSNNAGIPPVLVNPQPLNTRRYDEISDSIVDDLVSQYSIENRPIDGNSGTFSPSDPMANAYGPFDGYVQKKQLNMKKMEVPYSDSEHDERDFSHKKKRFSKRTPDDVKDLFDINKMLPQEIEEDWFDVEPLQSTKKIRGTHLIHPMKHMGVNTVGSSLKNATHDIRGDIPNPKINVSPWNNSTIEPDTNIKGLCSSN